MAQLIPYRVNDVSREKLRPLNWPEHEYAYILPTGVAAMQFSFLGRFRRVYEPILLRVGHAVLNGDSLPLYPAWARYPHQARLRKYFQEARRWLGR